MKERPILFSAPMVRAILSGSKTQTRRIVKGAAQEAMNLWRKQCKFGQPGNRLWVRETWNAWSVYEVDSGVFEAGWPYMKIPKQKPSNACVLYAADAADDGGRWRPSIHMPRWASRISLEITGIWVERLQDIGDVDAHAEGCATPATAARSQFRNLWESINGPGSWAANPWVWVIEFRRIKP